MYRYEKLIDQVRLDASNSGNAIGYQKAMDEKARDAWANTPAGKKAYNLDQKGLLDTAIVLENNLIKFYQCSGDKWRITLQKNGRRACWPYEKGGKGEGWYLP